VISIKKAEEIENLKRGGKLLAGILREVTKHVSVGTSTKELDELAEKLIRRAGGKPSFKGYNPYGAKRAFPATLCVSVNDEVVHGIPKRSRVLRAGDIVSLDIGMFWPVGKKGTRPMATDMAVTVSIGKVPAKSAKLIRDTKEALRCGIAAVRAGAKTGDVGAAIQEYLEARSYGIVRDLAGHGVGYQVHEEPFVPNYGRRGEGVLLKEGMVIAIEPMTTLGDWHVRLDSDDWTFRTGDGSLAAHFEHTLVVTKTGSTVVTD
jgi:methionyl aminopeptidase